MHALRRTCTSQIPNRKQENTTAPGQTGLLATPGVCADQFRDVILSTRHRRTPNLRPRQTGNNAMSKEWYARPVLFVTDIDRSVDFYVQRLGFKQSWRYDEQGTLSRKSANGARVASLAIFPVADGAWARPDRAGRLTRGVGSARRRCRRTANGAFHFMVVADPDGNQLYFPYPVSSSARAKP